MTGLFHPLEESPGHHHYVLAEGLLGMDQELRVVHPLELGVAAIRELRSVASQEPLELGNIESRYEVASNV